jgi:hypothetical protein
MWKKIKGRSDGKKKLKNSLLLDCNKPVYVPQGMHIVFFS